LSICADARAEEHCRVCRVVAYLGEPIVVDDLLFSSEHALVSQSVRPSLMSLLNIGGFGMVAWDAGSRSPETPFSYRTAGVPIFDRNLKALASKVHATACIAHVRGVVYDPAEQVGPHNVHPFKFPGARISLAQNGDLFNFAAMRFDLLDHVRPDLARQIEGTTDTEWVYALLLSQLEDPLGPAEPDELAEAVVRTLAVLRDVRVKHGIATQSPVNLVVSDGRSMVATRFAFDYGWYPDDNSFFAGEREFDFTTLWFSSGPGKRSACIASEPVTQDRGDWIEVPEYCMVIARPTDDGVELESLELAA
jgi:glutamine amidotransferase